MRDVYRDWRLGPDNDIDFAEGSAAAAERLTNALGTQSGEYRWDLTVGMPWLYQVLSQKGDNPAIRQLITEQILRDTEIDSVGPLKANFDRAQRRQTYSLSARLVSGVSIPLTVP